MKIIQSQTQEQHLVRLVSSRTLQPYDDGDLQVTSVTTQVPGASNSNKNTRVVASAKAGGKAVGSGTFDYNRIALSSMNSLLPSTVNAYNTDTHASIRDRILKQFGIPADQVTFTNPSEVPPQGRTRDYVLTPVASSLLFTPGTRTVAAKNVSGPAPAYPDQYALYLSGDNAVEGSQGFTNLVNNTTLAVTGNTKHTRLEKKYGTGSILFDGAGDYLTIPRASVGTFLTGDFTIEMWLRPTALAGLKAVFAQWSQATAGPNMGTGFIVMLNGASVVWYWAGNQILTSTSALTLNVWNHLAITRQGTTFRIFINGVLAGSVVNASNLAAIPVDYTLGTYYSPSYTFPASGVGDYAGYLDELGVRIGVAKYTANFTPVSLST